LPSVGSYSETTKLPDCLVDYFSFLLPKDILRKIGVHPNGLPRFATNFGMNRDVDGMALPRQIYFRAGKYDPYSVAGIALIAHELKHEQQWEKYGPLGFLRRYGFTQNNKLEDQAYAFGDWIEKDLRQGLSLKKAKPLPCKR